MRRFFLALVLVLALAFNAGAQIVKSGWTSTADPVTARAALGFVTTNLSTLNVTNVYTNFSVPVLTIGIGTNAVTLGPTNGTVTVGPDSVNWLVPNVTAGTVTANTSMTLNGVTITDWPAGSTGGIVTNGEATLFYISFQTNYSPVFGSALTNLGYFTNGFARAEWTATNGSLLTMEYSTDNTNWTAATAYNAPAWLRLSVVFGSLNPGTEAVTNFTVWSVQNLGTIGYTNDYTLQTFLVASPTTGSEASSKDYADFTALTAATDWSTHPAVADVQLDNHPLRPDQLWKMGRSVVSNEVRLAWSFAGNELLSLSPGFTGISNGVSITATGAVAYIAVATNHAPGPFRVLCSSNNWQWFDEISVTNSYPTASGTNYLLTFPAPTGAGSWVYQVGRSNAASASGLSLPRMASAAMRGGSQVFTTSPTNSTNRVSYSASSGVYNCTANLTTGEIVNGPAGTYRVTFNGTALATNNFFSVRLYVNGVNENWQMDTTASTSLGQSPVIFNWLLDLAANTTNQIRFFGHAGYENRSVTNASAMFSLEQIR